MQCRRARCTRRVTRSAQHKSTLLVCYLSPLLSLSPQSLGWLPCRTSWDRPVRDCAVAIARQLGDICRDPPRLVAGESDSGAASLTHSKAGKSPYSPNDGLHSETKNALNRCYCAEPHALFMWQNGLSLRSYDDNRICATRLLQARASRRLREWAT